MKRSSGILLHIASLPGSYGIGSLGREARLFIDFLEKAGQSWWQVLPPGPTGYGDSPYQSFSSFAGNPYFIDLDILVELGLMSADTLPPAYEVNAARVNYEKLYNSRYALLRSVFERNRKALAFEMEAFASENEAWLSDYALYMAVKGSLGMASWQQWPEELRMRRSEALARAREELKDEIDFHVFMQMLFFRQWQSLKAYANSKGIGIIGDLPIYPAEDGADVWSNPGCFLLDNERRPIAVAGVPPDYFSETGQLWGNPLYDWEVQKRDGYAWWMQRIGQCLKQFDIIRIDHFRGFDTYWSAPAGSPTAASPGSQWNRGPGMELLGPVIERFGRESFIAEDLGDIGDGTRALLRDTGFPGMRVLEFAFDMKSDSPYLPHNYVSNTVAYTGTHDNAPIMQWYAEASRPQQAFARRYCKLDRREGFHWGFLRTIWASVADLAVAPAQDLLGLGRQSRMNTPSTVGGNWQWRLQPGALSDELAEELRDMTALYRRLP